MSTTAAVDAERRGRGGGADRRPSPENASHRNDDSRPQAVAQMRVPADRRSVQAARRDQPAVAALAGGARARRGRLLVGQSCAGRGHRRQAAGHRGDDRDAGRRARGSRSRRPERRAPRSSSSTARAIAARRSPLGSRRKAARPSCRASTIRTSSPGRAASGSRSSSSLARAPPPDRHSRPAAADWRRGSRSPVRTREIVCVEPEGWDDMGRSLEAGEIIPVGADPPPTLCDALQTPRVSPITFAILREREATRVGGQRSRGARGDALRLARASTDRRAGRGGRARRAAGGQGRNRPRERWRSCRAGMSIPSCTPGSLSGEIRPRAVRYWPGPRWAGDERSTLRVNSSSSSGQGAQFGGERLGIGFGQSGGGVEQGFEHHRDARQDRLLDPLERLFEPRLLFAECPRRPILDATWVKYW